MTYLVLARKWRPQNFDQVIGQDLIIKTLTRALDSDRVAHAFLLTGSRGVGKTTVARLLAKAMSCEQGLSSKPCQKCSHCLEITRGESLDVLEIDGASHTGVDDIRELRENIRFQPSSARYKIFIIDEVHMLSNNAFNALLKTLEEPPPHVKFIFATTESHKIPITILSRCQRYDFRRLNVKQIVKQLQFILKQEKIVVSKEALYLIAENADGGMRDALSLLDQVISFSGDQASSQDVIDILGLVDREIIIKTVKALLDADPKKSLLMLEQAFNLGVDYKKLIDSISGEFRNLCLSKAAGSIKGLADITQERAQEIDKLAKKFDSYDLQRLFEMSLKTCDNLAFSEHPKLILELAFVKIATRPRLSQLSEVEKAIEKLSEMHVRHADRSASLRAERGNLTVLESPEIATSSAVASGYGEIPRDDGALDWKSFVSNLCEKNPGVGFHLEHARYLGKGLMEFDQKLHFMRVGEACKKNSFIDLFKQNFNFSPQAKLSESIHVAKKSAEKRKQINIEEQAKNNPVIQKALEIFGGDIKAVRRKD